MHAENEQNTNLLEYPEPYEDGQISQQQLVLVVLDGVVQLENQCPSLITRQVQQGLGPLAVWRKVITIRTGNTKNIYSIEACLLLQSLANALAVVVGVAGELRLSQHDHHRLGGPMQENSLDL